MARKIKFELTLPWPPSDNEHYEHTRRGVFLTHKAKAFRMDVLAAFINSRQKKQMGALSLSVDCYPPELIRKRDILNISKELCDALQKAGVIENDYDFWETRLRRFKPEPGGKVVVRISEFVGLVSMEVGA